jgi:hypothetical protein
MQYFTAYFGNINKNVVGIFSTTPNLQNIRFFVWTFIFAVVYYV